MSLLRSLSALAAAGAFAVGGAFASAPPPASPDAEKQLIEAINQIEEGKLEQARASLDDLVEKHPNFKLAKLFQGELEAVMSGKPLPQAKRMTDEDKRGLMDEARLRLWQEEIPTD